MKRIFIDIKYSFIRQPIKLAIASVYGDSIEFVMSDTEADLVLTTSDRVYKVPTLYLSDSLDPFLTSESTLTVSPIPTNDNDMRLLIERLRAFV